MLKEFFPEKDRYFSIKILIGAYGIMLIFEGALRKWIIPGLSNPLLIVRDPIVLLIYMMAIRQKCFPANGFIFSALLLACISFLFGLFSSSSNILITIYGLRINYFHIPLIFIMGQVLTREDVYKLGKIFMLLAIPMTLIVVMQFYRPRNHFINLGPGGVVTLGITGAMGRFRPSGTFSFITGLGAYYPLVSAFLLASVIQKRPMNTILTIIIGSAILIAIPFSISRLMAISCAIVLVGALIAVYYTKGVSKNITRLLFLGTIIIFAATFLPFFDEGTDVFEARWELATGEGAAGFKKNIIMRALESFTGIFQIMEYAPLTGQGVGVGSNVAAKMLTGQTGFLLAENEWQKIILELGPLLGLAFIIYRIMLTIYIGRIALSSSQKGNPLPIVLFFAVFLLVLNGQWAPPTTHGFSIFGAGLTLAACNSFHENAIQKNLRRGISGRFLRNSEKRLLFGRRFIGKPKKHQP